MCVHLRLHLISQTLCMPVTCKVPGVDSIQLLALKTFHQVSQNWDHDLSIINLFSVSALVHFTCNSCSSIQVACWQNFVSHKINWFCLSVTIQPGPVGNLSPTQNDRLSPLGTTNIWIKNMRRTDFLNKSCRWISEAFSWYVPYCVLQNINKVNSEL